MTLFDTSQPSTTTPPPTTAADTHDLPLQSRTDEQKSSTPPLREISGYEAITLSIPPPPSVYNRSIISSVISSGASTTSRSSISNKIAPAPAPPSPKHPLNTAFQPISNTRFNPGRSPKPKARSQHSRSSNKRQQQYQEKSTIIELEPSSTEQDVSNKNVPLILTSGKSTPTSRSSGNLFRRFITSGSTIEKSASSTLLYPPTSDDEHPMSPASSGNDDDDNRPLTSSSSKHHQTPL
jgi:hypothetical protein